MRLLISLVVAASVAFPAEPYFPPPDSQGGWRTLKSAAEIRNTGGLDIDRLDQAFRYAQMTSQHGGIVVVRHGYLVYEKYFGKAHRESHPDMASIGKAYASIAVGIALAEKKSAIPDGLEQKVFNATYLPEALPLADPRKADIKLGHLLSMSSGMRESGSQTFVRGVVVPTDAPPRPTQRQDQDQAALTTPLWTSPGEGYTYSSQSTHVATIVLRHLVGMELQRYLDEKLAKPMGYGVWGYALHRNGTTLPHTPGGGSVAVRATDAVRFAYLLLHNGRWGKQQLVPADYIAMCAKPSPYNPHSPFSLMFEVNQDGHVIGAPKDAFFKSGAGGSALYVVPSLDLAIYKMASSDAQLAPELTGLPITYPVNGSRDDWKPGPHTQFHDGPIGGDDGVRRLLEMVVAAVVK